MRDKGAKGRVVRRSGQGRGHIVLALAVGAILAATAYPAIATPQAGAARTHVVRVKDIDYHPARLAIRRGERVTWRFLDGPATKHSVTSSGSHRFHSSHEQFGGSYSVRFTRRGTYRYHCTVHDFMSGSVVVR